MKFVSYSLDGVEGLAIQNGQSLKGRTVGDGQYPGDLLSLLRKGSTALIGAAKALEAGDDVDLTRAKLLPPISNTGKVICIGLNYHDHAAESKIATPTYPTVFARFNSSLLGHGSPMICPVSSHELDYEGELVAVIGARSRHVDEADALSRVAGYSIFNDGSIRDYQFKAPQWTPGKNFDGTGAFGPCFVTADALPQGCNGLRLTTRLNGAVVQSASIDDMVFSVAKLVSVLSEFMTLEPGDLIVTGTPSGVGAARKPPLFMKQGDICEVEIENIGCLTNPIVKQAAIQF